MKLIYRKTIEKTYEEWQKDMWLIYNTPISEIQKRLNVSREWVVHFLLKEINYVVYHNKFIYERTGKSELTFISKKELGVWIAKNATFERQTELIDLYSYIPDKQNKIYGLYKDEFHGLNKGTIPEKVFEELRKDFHLSFKPQNCSPINRSKYPMVKIEGFNILDYNLYFVKGTSETVYRKAFINGDIKVKIRGKTIFVRQTYPKMKMPYLIPYGQTIKVYNTKKSL